MFLHWQEDHMTKWSQKRKINEIWSDTVYVGLTIMFNPTPFCLPHVTLYTKEYLWMHTRILLRKSHMCSLYCHPRIHVLHSRKNHLWNITLIKINIWVGTYQSGLLTRAGGAEIIWDLEPEPKLFETWSRSRIYLFNKYFLPSVWRMIGWRKTSIETYFLWNYCCSTVLSGNIWQKLELELEPEPK